MLNHESLEMFLQNYCSSVYIEGSAIAMCINTLKKHTWWNTVFLNQKKKKIKKKKKNKNKKKGKKKNKKYHKLFSFFYKKIKNIN